MQIHELPTISGSPSGGYFATDNGTQTTKIDYTALAQAIIEQYNASTLAGSAQSVKAALDGVMADSVLTRGASETVTASTNINDYTTPGTYFFNSSTKAVNAPGNSGYFRLVVTAPAGVVGGTNRVRYQEAVTTEGKVYTRRLNSSDGGQAWVAQAWAETPTRAEVDAIASNTYEELTSDASSGTVNISRYGKVRILTFTDVVAAGNTISLSAALATTDRPRMLTGGVLFASDNSVARVWVRLVGTIGTTNVTSGKTYNGELVYIVA